VLDQLRVLFSSRTDIADVLAPLDLDAHSLDAALRNASALSERWLTAPPIEMRSLVRELVGQVIIAADRIDVHLNRAKIAAALETRVQGEPNLDPVILSIEAKLRRAGKGKRLVIANGAGVELNQGVIALIKEAFAIRNQLLLGSDDSIEAMSARIGMNKFRLTSLVRLSYLAPGIIRALLAGQHPTALTPTRLLRLAKTCRMTGRNSAASSVSPPKPASKSGTKRSTSDNSKLASRDPARVCPPHLDVWCLWLESMRSPAL
jgi:site-specific DNA recombinase